MGRIPSHKLVVSNNKKRGRSPVYEHISRSALEQRRQTHSPRRRMPAKTSVRSTLKSHADEKGKLSMWNHVNTSLILFSPSIIYGEKDSTSKMNKRHPTTTSAVTQVDV